MSGRRVARAQDLIRQEVSKLLLFKVKDPRLSGVNVNEVRMTPDLRRAVVRYGCLGDEAEKQRIREGLERAAGFIRREVGRAVKLKYVPEIVFEYDRSGDYARHMDQVFKEIEGESEAEDGSGGGQN